MTRNLFAVNDFQKGELGCVKGHLVAKATGNEPHGTLLVVALRDVKSGTAAWFGEPNESK
jgi:hypothetical protein